MELQGKRLEGAAAEPCKDRRVKVAQVAVGVAEDDVGEDGEMGDVWLPGVVTELVREALDEGPVCGDGSDREDNSDDVEGTEVLADRCEDLMFGVAANSVLDSNIDNPCEHANVDCVHVERDSETPFDYIPVYSAQHLQDRENRLKYPGHSRESCGHPRGKCDLA